MCIRITAKQYVPITSHRLVLRLKVSLRFEKRIYVRLTELTLSSHKRDYLKSESDENNGNSILNRSGYPLVF